MVLVLLMALLAPAIAAQQRVPTSPAAGASPVATPRSPAPDGPLPDGETSEQIAKDAARDLTPTRFYNRPNATRTDFNAAWQDCRLIARGSRTPSGSIPMYYNPALMSPLAVGIAGGIGGAIGAMIAEGEQRRANRQSCLLIRGWRLVEADAVAAAPALAMTETARSAFLDRQIGALDPSGPGIMITERKSFVVPDDPALRFPPATSGVGSFWRGKDAGPAGPLALKPDEAAVVIAFWRPPSSTAAGRSGFVHLARYDLDKRQLVYRPRDWKAKGDHMTYAVEARSGDKLAVYEVQLLRVTPGDYVLDSSSAGPTLPEKVNCLGAPTFHVEAGEVAYLGDFVPVWNARLSSRARFSDLVYAGQSDNARLTLAATVGGSTLAERMKPVTWRNRATYACVALLMERVDLPDAEPLLDIAPAPAPP